MPLDPPCPGSPVTRAPQTDRVQDRGEDGNSRLRGNHICRETGPQSRSPAPGPTPRGQTPTALAMPPCRPAPHPSRLRSAPEPARGSAASLQKLRSSFISIHSSQTPNI